MELKFTLRVITARVYYVLRGSLTSPFVLIIQWRWQRHLMLSTTHGVVSREIILWKSFDLLLGSNLRPLAPSAGCLTARLPELTIRCFKDIHYNIIHIDSVQTG